MESNKPWVVFVIFLAIAFLALMGSIRGLRLDRVSRDNARWREIHLVWDWNTASEWWQGVNPLREKTPREMPTLEE